MFTWRHFVWLGICLAIIVTSVVLYRKKRPSLKDVLSICCGVCVYSEVTKVFSTIQMVPSSDGSIILPYIPTNHLPLHLCSIQILLIFFVRFTENKKMREKILAFMYPTCLIGAIMALAMPSIFTTSIPVEKAFTAPISYQFFIFHSMLIALGLIIAMSGEVRWEKKHIYSTLIIIAIAAFVSIYVNSLLASPTYVDGKLVSVDFWPNFFFTYNNPLGIRVTEKWQWLLYLAIISALAIVLVTLCYLPLLKKNKD
ncbi:MAG: YwaF family protein [Erysipelotrichaceae bacterium]|nr:YwaF family protein [Erysipelotrichaceae bacterium]